MLCFFKKMGWQSILHGKMNLDETKTFLPSYLCDSIDDSASSESSDSSDSSISSDSCDKTIFPPKELCSLKFNLLHQLMCSPKNMFHKKKSHKQKNFSKNFFNQKKLFTKKLVVIRQLFFTNIHFFTQQNFSKFLFSLLNFFHLVFFTIKISSEKWWEKKLKIYKCDNSKN